MEVYSHDTEKDGGKDREAEQDNRKKQTAHMA